MKRITEIFRVSDTKNGENVPTLPTRDKESVLKVVKQQK